jgi:hypothetical protein
MAKPDASRNDDQPHDPLDDTTFETAGDDDASDASDASDATTTDDTRAIGVEEPATSRDLFGNPVEGSDRPVTGATGTQDRGWPPTLPERPSGPHAPAIVLGLVCMVVAGIILAQELGSLTVDWGDIGPVGIVLTGAVLVLFGLVGLLSSRRNSTTG